MRSENTLILTKNEVSELLPLRECIAAVEKAFEWHALGRTQPPAILGIHAERGGFHIKAGMMNLSRNYFVAKVNANFPGNYKINGLPAIQGIIVVCDADNGQLLALMDSAHITIVRTGAATAVAAKYLAPPDARVVAIFGCGNQGRISASMLLQVLPIEKVFAFDTDREQANKFAHDLKTTMDLDVEVVDDVISAASQSQLLVTCTPSAKPFLKREHVNSGSFIAAVGADSENKQELFPELIQNNKVVVDITKQCETIGELHHAIKNGMTTDNVHAELGQIIAGQKKGRTNRDEIIIFDSTGTALQDIVSAAIVYEKALHKGIGLPVAFGN